MNHFEKTIAGETRPEEKIALILARYADFGSATGLLLSLKKSAAVAADILKYVFPEPGGKCNNRNHAGLMTLAKLLAEGKPVWPIQVGQDVALLALEIHKREKRLQERGKTCVWSETADFDLVGDPYFETGCGESWIFLEGGIEENRIKFCPYCGGKIGTEEGEKSEWVGDLETGVIDDADGNHVCSVSPKNRKKNMEKILGKALRGGRSGE